MRVEVIHGDMLVELESLPAASFSACVTDPPYGLAFMGKKWDDEIAFQPETWAAVGRVLKPGAHLVAFAGTKGFHRMMCAIEDAGFELRDTFAWLFGQGFPKSHDVSKAIDKAAGRPIEIVPKGAPVKRMIPGADQHRDGWEKNNGREYQPGEFIPSEEAAPWQGWGTALKPAYEPIVLARWPMDRKTVAANVLAHGTGALNVDACRIEGDSVNARDNKGRGMGYGGDDGERGAWGGSKGRWPANVVHDGSDEVVAAFPDTSSGAGAVKRSSSAGHRSNALGVESRPAGTPMIAHADSGSAARFFKSAPFTEEERRLFYSSKADAGDRLASKHPTVKPVDLMRWLVRLVTPPGGRILDPFAGSGTTGMAAMAEGFDATLIEREAEYVADIRRRIAHVHGDDTPLFGGGS